MVRKNTAHLLRELYKTYLYARICEFDRTELQQSAVIFAPHPDDETLGCGGTIYKKKQQGADVKIVFMTDGRNSHGHLMPPAELAILRANEAIAAAAELGVAEKDVFLLGFTDGRLGDYETPAIDRVTNILCDTRPQQVFIPDMYDRPADHQATYRIVNAALARINFPVTVYEYPVWFWHHWPWVSLPLKPQRSTLALFRNSLAAGFGLQLYHRFQHGVYIEDIWQHKQAALEQHHTQMTRLQNKPEWAILADVCNGEFLNCFFGKYEIFRRRSINLTNNNNKDVQLNVETATSYLNHGKK
ncbi:MAG: PIG-L family deacetylase [Anaerolineae bacterium]|nr:PIG-L family deacetylase [Anaerolineae bacterium]